jgi:3-phenylpropionate/cinnamic acid dioxygenase small subunit
VTSRRDDDRDAALIERHRIEDLVIRYATSLDRRDWDALRECFFDDAVADYGVLGRYEGVDAILTGAREPLQRLDASQHLLGNLVVEFTDADNAVVTSYVQAQHYLANAIGDSLATIGGTYTDEVRRVEGRWRIARLTLAVTWQTGNTSILAPRAVPDRFGRAV